MLRTVATTTVGMVVVGYFLFSAIGVDESWFGGKLVVILVVAIWTAIASVLFYVAVKHLNSNGEFICHIDDKEFVCISPSDLPESLKGGETFSLRILDIAKLEEEKDSELSNLSRWYIWSTSGERFWLTSSYDNPVERFVEAIRERVPDIVVTKT